MLFGQFPYLVEDCFVWTDEAPPESLVPSIGVLHRQTDVEDLAVVFHVRIVAVASTFAAEGVCDFCPDAGRVARKS